MRGYPQGGVARDASLIEGEVMTIWLVAGYAMLALYMVKVSFDDEDGKEEGKDVEYREEDDYEQF